MIDILLHPVGFVIALCMVCVFWGALREAIVRRGLLHAPASEEERCLKEALAGSIAALLCVLLNWLAFVWAVHLDVIHDNTDRAVAAVGWLFGVNPVFTVVAVYAGSRAAWSLFRLRRYPVARSSAQARASAWLLALAAAGLLALVAMLLALFLGVTRP